MKQTKIFILDSKESFDLAERFKWDLENNGFKVCTEPYGLIGVKITGEKPLIDGETVKV